MLAVIMQNKPTLKCAMERSQEKHDERLRLRFFRLDYADAWRSGEPGPRGWPRLRKTQLSVDSVPATRGDRRPLVSWRSCRDHLFPVLAAGKQLYQELIVVARTSPVEKMLCPNLESG